MNIKPLLVRLQNAIGRDDLIEQMVLHSTPKKHISEETQSKKSVNLIVGYNSSPNSHTALDIALLIAHQTRLATKTQVTVQVVYVIEDNQCSNNTNVLPIDEVANNRVSETIPLHLLASCTLGEFDTGVTTRTKFQGNAPYSQDISVDKFAQAEGIIRQATCLAAEWKTSFKAHLRFGCVASELQQVVISESADILFIGCHSVNHPLVQKLGSDSPCSILGIPSSINHKRD